MNLKLYIPGLIILLLLLTTACSNETTATKSTTQKVIPKAESTQGEELIKHDSESYTISYPKDWTLTTISKNAELITILDNTGKESFKRNFTVLVSDRGDITFDELVEKFTKEITAIQKNAVIDSSQKLERNGLAYQEVIFSSPDFGTKNINHYLVQNQKGFFLGYTTTIDDFENYQAQALEVLNSFIAK